MEILLKKHYFISIKMKDIGKKKKKLDNFVQVWLASVFAQSSEWSAVSFETNHLRLLKSKYFCVIYDKCTYLICKQGLYIFNFMKRWHWCLYRRCKLLNFAKWLNFAKYLGSKVPTFLDVRVQCSVVTWEATVYIPVK